MQLEVTDGRAPSAHQCNSSRPGAPIFFPPLTYYPCSVPFPPLKSSPSDLVCFGAGRLFRSWSFVAHICFLLFCCSGLRYQVNLLTCWHLGRLTLYKVPPSPSSSPPRAALLCWGVSCDFPVLLPICCIRTGVTILGHTERPAHNYLTPPIPWCCCCLSSTLATACLTPKPPCGCVKV